jgi:uncharacterized protein YycO
MGKITLTNKFGAMTINNGSVGFLWQKQKILNEINRRMIRTLESHTSDPRRNSIVGG